MADDLGASRPHRTSLPQLTDRLALGTTGLAVSPCCLGMTTPDTVAAAFAAGINFFFVTVDMHWPAYDGLRTGLRDLLRGGVDRDAIVVAATTYVAQREFLAMPFTELLEAVPELGRIDVVVAGGTYAADYSVRRDVLRGHVDAGRFGARGVGCSFHQREAAADPINAGEIDVGFVRYNPQHLGARKSVFPRLAADRTARVFGFKSTSGVREVEQLVARDPELDTWIPAPPDYYRFALARPELDGVLCALDSPDELDELVDVLAGPPLTAEEEDHMIALVAAAGEPG